jgi:hypothetical protein
MKAAGFSEKLVSSHGSPWRRPPPPPHRWPLSWFAHRSEKQMRWLHVTRHQTRLGTGFEFQRGKRYISSPKAPKSSLGPTEPRIPWVPGFAAVEWLGREFNHSPQCSEVRNEWSRTSSPRIRLHGVDNENDIFSLSLLRLMLLRVPSTLAWQNRKLPRYELFVRSPILSVLNSSASCQGSWRLRCGEVNVATYSLPPKRDMLILLSGTGFFLSWIQSASVPGGFRSSNQGRLVKNEESISILRKQFTLPKTENDLEKRWVGIMENTN